MDSEPLHPRALPSPAPHRPVAWWAVAAGLFVALILAASPLNQPSRWAIAAVSVDDVPAQSAATAVEVRRKHRSQVTTERPRVGARWHRLRRSLRRLCRIEPRFAWWGIPPPGRRGPPRGRTARFAAIGRC